MILPWRWCLLVEDDLTEVVRLELLLLQPDVQKDPEQVRRLMHRDFCAGAVCCDSRLLASISGQDR